MRILDTLNSPGKSGTAGDDRYGFDEAAGRAWVIDGATDVGDIRLFGGESDAGWWAGALCDALARPAEINDVEAYFHDVIEAASARARIEARIDPDKAPGASRPCASGMWLRLRPGGGSVDLAWLGDCVALIADASGGIRTFGDFEGVRDEARANRAWHADGASPAKRREQLQASRAANTSSENGPPPVFSLDPASARVLNRAEIDIGPGAVALIATDGLYRTVSPYERFSDAALLEAAREHGLGHVAAELRALERDPADDARYGRLKRSDDACAVLVAFDVQDED